MKPPKVLEQSIAVFGESGSGKTVLLSSFYGAMQGADFDANSLFHLTADDTGQGNRLYSNYLGMRNAGRVPPPNAFSATTFAFSARFKGGDGKKTVDALRLMWHDYPGEWFAESPANDEEARRRVDTFRALLSADVAVLLVDGQRLLDEAGQEEKYLRLLFANVRNSLLSLERGLLPDGQRLNKFPRIWVLGLSKADLLPAMDVHAFRELVVEKAAGDLEALSRAIGELVEGSEALAIGEDYVLLSSARFDASTEKIQVSDRVGVDLIHPMAAVLPLEAHVRWAHLKTLPPKVGKTLIGSVSTLAGLLAGKKLPLPGPVGVLVGLITPGAAKAAADLAGAKLVEVHDAALHNKEHAAATLAAFKMALEQAEKQNVLFRGIK